MQCNVPWLILMDPTSACNLHCTGCWAAEYGHKLNLSFEDLDSIDHAGQRTGYLFLHVYRRRTAGAQGRSDSSVRETQGLRTSVAFTNATLVDDEFCKDLVRVGNFSSDHSVWRALRKPTTADAVKALSRRRWRPWICFVHTVCSLEHPFAIREIMWKSLLRMISWI